MHLGPSEKLELDPIEWKPSAATQLSELVQAEMKKETPKVVSSGMSGEPETTAELPAFHAPSGGSGFAQEQRSVSWVPVLLVVLAVSGVLYAQGFIQLGNGESSSPKTSGVASTIPVAEAKPVTPQPESTAKAPAVAEPATKVEEVEGAAPPVVEAKKPAVKKKPKRPKKTVAPKKKAKRPAPAKPPAPKSASDDIDDVFSKAPTLPARLSMQQVQNATKKNSLSLRPCIGSAIDNREVTPGRHTLELTFNILPNGRVQKSKMAGPYYLQGTQLTQVSGSGHAQLEISEIKRRKPCR